VRSQHQWVEWLVTGQNTQIHTVHTSLSCFIIILRFDRCHGVQQQIAMILGKCDTSVWPSFSASDLAGSHASFRTTLHQRVECSSASPRSPHSVRPMQHAESSSGQVPRRWGWLLHSRRSAEGRNLRAVRHAHDTDS
jgi:hypothetical protein